MQIRHLATWTALAASLAAQDSAPGFKWVGLRGGTMSFDPQENVKAAPLLGGQAGMVFDEQKYGLTLEGFTSRPESQLTKNEKVNHSLVSVTLLSGLAGDSLGGFWPYFGLGLGAATAAKKVASTPTLSTSMATEAHASFGFLHRPVRGLIWGAEGRYLVTFANPGLSAFQSSVLLGISWGGQSAHRSAAPAPPPPPPAPAPAPAPEPLTPPPPAPVVKVAPPPPPPPRPAAPPAATPQPTRPILVVEAAPPPAPTPTVAAPPPMKILPPPATAPAPAASAPPGVPPIAAGSSLAERLNALRKENMPKALELGRKRIQALPAGHWTIRLEVANLPSTLRSAVGAFPAGDPDLFIAPIQLRGGKTAYQLFLGDYPSEAAAERAARAVPAFFREGGNRPKPFKISAIPAKVGP